MEIRKDSLLYHDFPNCHYIDSFEYVIMDKKDKIDVIKIAERFIQPGPKWFEGLFALRNKIVSVFNLKTPATVVREKSAIKNNWEIGTQAGIFKVFGKSATEIVLGDDDKHLDVRVSLLLNPYKEKADRKQVVVTTVVKYNNRLGRIYFFFVKPFHRTMVPLLLKRNMKQLEADFNK